MSDTPTVLLPPLPGLVAPIQMPPLPQLPGPPLPHLGSAPAPPVAIPYTGSWAPRRLGQGGPAASPAPTVMSRDDGCSLLYRGRIHTVIGPHSSLKTWTMFMAAAQELVRGEAVLWIDLEDTEATATDRLLALGVPLQTIDDKFIYIRPEEGLDDDAEAALAQLLQMRRPSLIVVDSTNEFIHLHGGQGTSSDSVYTQDLHIHLRNFASWYGAAGPGEGAAVVAIDHVTKNIETQGSYAIGTERKISGLDGAAYKVTLKERFGVGRTGTALLEVIKDRPGRVDSLASGTRVVAKLILASDQSTGRVSASLVGPTSTDGQPVEDMMQQVSSMLSSEPSGLKKGELTRHFKDKSHELEDALRRLKKEGHIVIEQIGPAKLHKLVRPYPVPDDAPVPPS